MRDLIRTKWAAVGAALAVTLGAGGVSLTQAAISDGEKPVYVALVEPCRLVDTRPASNIGPKNTPISAGDAGVYEIQVTGANGNCTGGLAIPADAVAVATNVTAIAPVATATGRSYFTVYPGDAARPTTSNLNFLNGAPPAPNKVDVGLSATGTIKIYNNEGTAHAAVDVFGYYIDHNHDDRYYTETEVDTALGAKANTADIAPGLPDAAIGFNADGTIRSGVDNVDTITYDAGLDRYEITFTDFNFNINDDVASVVARQEGVIATYSSVGGSTLLVYLRDHTGAAVEAPFTVVVWDLG
jgi:hypothetical protein